MLQSTFCLLFMIVMLVTNNKENVRYLFYNVGGIPKSIRFGPFETIEVIDLNSSAQITYNSLDFKLKGINERFGTDFTIDFTISDIPLDADAATFLSYAGISNDSTTYYQGTIYERTGSQLCSYINELVLDLKGEGLINSTINFWTEKNLKVFHPIIGGTASSHKYNLRNPEIFEIQFQTGWTHSATGALPNGDTFADTGVAISDLNANNVNFGRYNGTQGDGGTVEMGVANAGNTQVWATFSNYDDTAYFTVNSYAVTTTDNLGLGLYATNRPGGNATEGYRRGVRIVTGTETAVFPAGNFYYAALNQGGTAAFKDKKELRSGHFLDGLTQSEMEVFNAIVDGFQDKLSRRTSVLNAYFYGDSTTAGAGASAPQYRWSSLVSVAKGWIETNNGINGSSMENAVPVDAISGPNMYDRRNTIPFYDLSNDGALFISYSINDCGINLSGYNTTNYSSQLSSIIDTALVTKGWPSERVVLVVGLYCTEANWNDYVGFGIGVTVPASNARHLTFISAAGNVATSKGIKWINPYQDMIDAGGTGPDGRHPNDAINAVIANISVLPNITDI